MPPLPTKAKDTHKSCEYMLVPNEVDKSKHRIFKLDNRNVVYDEIDILDVSLRIIINFLPLYSLARLQLNQYADHVSSLPHSTPAVDSSVVLLGVHEGNSRACPSLPYG